MSHTHYYKVDGTGKGVCTWTSCPERTRFFHNSLPQDIRPDRWNEAGFDRVPLRLRRIEESYD